MKTVTLKTFDNYFTANIILTKLQAEGIECYLFDENTVTIGPLISGAIGGIKLVVNVDDVEVAGKALDEFEKEYIRSISCPRCGANGLLAIAKPATKNYLAAILTWFFASYAIAPEQVYQCQQCGYESENLPINVAENN